MTFVAHIRRMSPLWNDWRRDVRVGGMINGVQFRWQNGAYCTEPLSNEQVAAVTGNLFVQVEAVGVMPEPDPEPEQPHPTHHRQARTK